MAGGCPGLGGRAGGLQARARAGPSARTAAGTREGRRRSGCQAAARRGAARSACAGAGGRRRPTLRRRGAQVLYSGNLDASKEQHLQRLCADVAAAVDLAHARVRVRRPTAQAAARPATRRAWPLGAARGVCARPERRRRPPAAAASSAVPRGPRFCCRNHGRLGGRQRRARAGAGVWHAAALEEVPEAAVGRGHRGQVRGDGQQPRGAGGGGLEAAAGPPPVHAVRGRGASPGRAGRGPWAAGPSRAAPRACERQALHVLPRGRPRPPAWGPGRTLALNGSHLSFLANLVPVMLHVVLVCTVPPARRSRQCAPRAGSVWRGSTAGSGGRRRAWRAPPRPTRRGSARATAARARLGMGRLPRKRRQQAPQRPRSAGSRRPWPAPIRTAARARVRTRAMRRARSATRAQARRPAPRRQRM